MPEKPPSSRPGPPRAALAVLLACATIGPVGASPALADTPSGEVPQRAPALAAASNFGQGWAPRLLEASRAIPVTDFRDAVYWSRVEKRPGQFRFQGARSLFPEAIERNDASLSLTVNWGNKLYDDGLTPYTPEGTAAFGAYAAEAAARFGNVTAIEVGNEFNGDNYLKGPVKDATGEARVDAYLALLEATYDAVKERRPETDVLGGATHSLPVGYLWSMLDKGAADHMDALAVHPYTTPPEQLARQVAVLRRHEAARDLPLQITEFGEPDPALAPAHLVKMMCVMGLSGVERAAWYPLNDRGDELAPLVSPGGEVTAVGQAYAMAQERLAGRDVEDVAPDPFTYACRFGEDTLVVWGEPRSIEWDGDVDALHADGGAMAGTSADLSMDAPIVLYRAGGIALGESVRLGATDLVADSFHQFAYPGGEGTAEPVFERFARAGGRRVPLETLPGQESSGTPWYPYLGNPSRRPARMTAEHLVPGRGGDGSLEMVQAYEADEARVIDIEALVAPAKRSNDGVRAVLKAGDRVLADEIVTDERTLRFEGVDLAKGEKLELAVGPNERARGDVTRYRLTLRSSQ